MSFNRAQRYPFNRQRPQPTYHAPDIEPDIIPHDLGLVLETVSSAELEPTKFPIKICDPEYIASFNWMDSKDSLTIAIPGAPPCWTPPRVTTKLKEDNGQYFRDINAAYSPQHPMLPTAKAILASATPDCDLVACASTLRSLLCFVQGQAKTFRILVEVIGNTVFFGRREASPRELIPNVRGYGHSMPEAYTTWHADVRGSVSNHRIIGYSIGQLRCFVRYEPDGYFASAATPASTSTHRREDEFNLETALSRAQVSQRHNAAQSGGLLTVKDAGSVVPQDATFELKTRSIRRRDEDFFADFAPRLWLTQTPTFVLAFHKSGTFDEIRLENVQSSVSAWERENQTALRQFSNLLSRIVRYARDESEGMMELWRHEEGKLTFRVVGGDTCSTLPEDIEDEWTARQDMDDGSEDGVEV